MLYTGKGDGGTTKVLDSKERVPKSSPLPECLGTLDELNSFIGLCKVCASDEPNFFVRIGKRKRHVSEILHGVQEVLFVIQAETAGAKKRVKKERVTEVETIVNTIEKVIPPITKFSIAGGTELAALLDVARTLARRAERRMSGVEAEGLRTFSPHTKAYANRLSSLLFALARLANAKSGVKEEAPRYK